MEELSCTFPIDQGTAGELSSRETAPTAIWSPHAETLASCLGAVPENSAIPRGVGDQAVAHPNRRRRIRGRDDASGCVCLCWQVGRFGFALDSRESRDHTWRSIPRRSSLMWVG